MDASIDDPAKSQADVLFVSEISDKMHVPRHIRLGNENGDILNDKTTGARFANAMTVPDRILVADPFPSAEFRGNDETRPDRSSPKDNLNESFHAAHIRNHPVTLQTPPSTLTVQNGIYRTAVDELEERLNPKRFRRELQMGDNPEPLMDEVLQSQPSMHATLNSDQKLALLEKQVTRLNTRLYQIEDELESVQYWQKVMTCLGVTLVAMMFLKGVVNR